MSLSRLPVGARLTAGFASVLVLLALVTAIGLTRLAVVQSNSDGIVHRNLERIDVAENLATVSRANLQTATMMLVAPDQRARVALQQTLDSRSARVEKLRASLVSSGQSVADKALAGDMMDTLNSYRIERSRMTALALHGNDAAALAYLRSHVQPSFAAYIDTVDALVAHEQGAARLADAENNRLYAQSRTLLVAMTLSFVTLGVVLALAIARSITRPLRRALVSARALAAGDLSVTIDVTSDDEVGKVLAAIAELTASLGGIADEMLRLAEAAQRGDFTERGEISRYQNTFATIVGRLNSLMETSENGLSEVVRVMNAFANYDTSQKMIGKFQGSFGVLRDNTNRMSDSLGGMVIEILNAAEHVKAAAGRIASGNNELSQRTEAQASSLEETASSMEELTATVKQNGENAQHANQLAVSASEIAEKGGAVVNEVVQTMLAMNRSSKKIAEIIGVIDGIAFQTNILALNAAVEAARAGEQGRGFAVVAGEVRNLAQRSAGAAKEIKGLIGESVEKTDAGSRLVDEAGHRMTEIVTSVKHVADVISEITAASLEQGEGIDQVSHAVAQMDRVTQQNASLVEESAAAATSLEEQAKALVEIVARIKVSDTVLEARTSVQAASRTIVPVRPAPVPARPQLRERPVRKPLVASANTLGNGTTHAPFADDDGDWETF